MPILALVYILLPISVSIYSHGRSLIKRSLPLWFIAVDSTCDFIAFALFAGYWCKGIVHTMGVLAPLLFLFALAWRLGVASRTIRRVPEKTWRVLLHAYGLDGFIVAGAILYIPLYSFAGMAAFRNYDGT
jgi:hypothetical protein